MGLIALCVLLIKIWILCKNRSDTHAMRALILAILTYGLFYSFEPVTWIVLGLIASELAPRAHRYSTERALLLKGGQNVEK